MTVAALTSTALIGEPWILVASGALTTRDAAPPNPLTAPQVQVLTQISLGLTSAQIAAAMGLTTNAVEKLRTQINRALLAENAPHAVGIALRKGWIA